MLRPIHEIIRSQPRDATTERADWRGETARAKFEGARETDRARVRARTFGKRNRKD